MELLRISYCIMQSFDIQLCLLPARRWSWDRNNSADILCDPWQPAQRGKWSLLKHVMCPGSLLSCNGMERIKMGLNGSACRGNGQVTLLGPAAYVSITVVYCQIIVTSLTVTHVELDLGVRSWDAFQRFSEFIVSFISLCRHNVNIFQKSVDNCTYGIACYYLSFYMVALVFKHVLFYNVMWMCPTKKQKG